MNKCKKCGFLHYRTDPCRKPKNTNGDKAEPSADAKPNLKRQLAPVESAGPVRSEPLTLPVGEKQPRTRQPQGTRIEGMPTNQSEGISATTLIRTPDAVTGKFDKKAWMREYMREHRKGIRRRAK